MVVAEMLQTVTELEDTTVYVAGSRIQTSMAPGISLGGQ